MMCDGGVEFSSFFIVGKGADSGYELARKFSFIVENIHILLVLGVVGRIKYRYFVYILWLLTDKVRIFCSCVRVLD